ncbi:phosphate signaling complex protein PhoU [Thioclava sp. FR2]|uniref:phosphate signaling complex protein PhoU n=1 Tax=Thioclava sp. FR2 TaxID=3445780 RepID=UPI003EBEEE1D
MDPHIRTAFDKNLEAVQAQVMRMGGMVEDALLRAAEALDKRDEALATEVRKGDKAIDALEEKIHTDCARIIALQAPAASDLRTVLTVMRIVGSLERSGDYAKNLAKRSLVLNEMQVVPGSSGSIVRMARSVVALLHDALDAFANRDVELAEDVRRRDADIDQMYNALFREFLTHMMEDPRNITSCMHLHFIAKNIERVGDHATGIAEQVIYLVNGTLPDADRPKADMTALPPTTQD